MFSKLSFFRKSASKPKEESPVSSIKTLNTPFYTYEEALEKYSVAFKPGTKVRVKRNGSDEIIEGKFTWGSFGPTTFEINDGKGKNHTFEKKDITISIVEMDNDDSKWHRKGGKTKHRKKKWISKRRKTRKH